MLGGTALLSAHLLRLALGEVVLYETSVVTEGHAIGSSQWVGEVEASPQLRLTLMGREYSATAAYLPQFRLQYAPGDFNALHRANAGVSWQVDPTWRLDASASGSYGTNNLVLPDRNGAEATPGGAAGPSGGAGSGSPATAVQPVPAVTTLPYAAALVSTGLAARLDGASTLGATLTGALDGSPDDRSQVYLPMQYSASANLRYEWSDSADGFGSSLTGTVTRFSNGSVDAVASWPQEWRHMLTRDLQAWVAAGPSLAWGREPDTRHEVRQWMATAHVGMRDRIIDPAIDYALALRIAPSPDRITGAVYQRGDASVTAAWHPTSEWTVRSSASAGVVVSGAQSGDKVATGEVAVGWSERDEWRFEAGVRGLRQLPTGGDGQPALHLWTVFVGVTARDRGRL